METLNLYSEEDLRIQRIGARLLLMELLENSKNDWNGYGMKLWAERKIKELEDE